MLRGTFTFQVRNTSPDFSPESPFDISQDSARLLTSGPISVDTSFAHILGNLFLEPGEPVGQSLGVNCSDVGSASITLQSSGQTDPNGDAGSYSVATDFHFQCVENKEPGNDQSLTSYVDNAIGSAESEVDWVSFTEDGITLSVNQIDPMTLKVGESANIYTSFDSTSEEPPDNPIVSASLEFTSGGPVTVNDPGDRVEDGGVFNNGQIDIIIWGFHAGTVTCVEEGEGVYTANLTGQKQDGEAIKRNTSGLINCEDEPETETDDLVALRNAVASVFNLGSGETEVVYDDTQFRLQEAHDGCNVPHVHADFIVYAFQDWARGGLSGWKSNAELPLTDPDPDGCGFGDIESLSAKRVQVRGQDFLDLCAKLEETGMTSNMVRRCGQQRQFLTQE